ncbi:hypothetical protein NON00_23765, partial [Roseomonas sp. GC11]|uniref:hypothetical protein n=1 Tax=Roseomonas sp. GC11 TaxID=2950546 RepID=UPI002108B18E
MLRYSTGLLRSPAFAGRRRPVALLPLLPPPLPSLAPPDHPLAGLLAAPPPATPEALARAAAPPPYPP